MLPTVALWVFCRISTKRTARTSSTSRAGSSCGRRRMKSMSSRHDCSRREIMVLCLGTPPIRSRFSIRIRRWWALLSLVDLSMSMQLSKPEYIKANNIKGTVLRPRPELLDWNQHPVHSRIQQRHFFFFFFLGRSRLFQHFQPAKIRRLRKARLQPAP